MLFTDNINISPAIIDRIYDYMQLRDTTLNSSEDNDKKREIVENHLNRWYEGCPLSENLLIPEFFSFGVFGGKKVFAIIEEQNDIMKKRYG